MTRAEMAVGGLGALAVIISLAAYDMRLGGLVMGLFLLASVIDLPRRTP